VFYLKTNYFSDNKMSDRDNLESESDQPTAKKAKSFHFYTRDYIRTVTAEAQ